MKKRLPSPEHADTLSLDALRRLVTGLVEKAEVAETRLVKLEAENAALREENAALRLDNTRLKVENQLLRDEIARLKDRKSTRLNSSHVKSSYAVFCLKKKT